VDCQNAKTGLSPYLDGELPREDAAAIAAHLTQCERCRLLLEELRLVGTTLRAQLATHRVPSFGVRSKVRAALALLPAPRAPRASAWRSRRIWRRLGRTWLRARAR
jgi:anti-sigma factor RsiW